MDASLLGLRGLSQCLDLAASFPKAQSNWRAGQRPRFERLAQIKVPTLLITGEFDIPDVHSHMGAIEAGITGARRVVLPHAGHLPHLEVPQAFNAEVRKFVR
jgi:pimeloyl-ACP methyl ester carboxylesterase